jgi:hypothetical protein
MILQAYSVMVSAEITKVISLGRATGRSAIASESTARMTKRTAKSPGRTLRGFFTPVRMGAQ